MARIRTIKPQFWEDTDIAELSLAARLLYIGLWNFMDCNGVCEKNPKLIKRNVFPYDPIDVEPVVEELVSSGFLTVFPAGKKLYLHCAGFDIHQKRSTKDKPWYPPPPPKQEFSPTSHLPAGIFPDQSDKEKEKEKEKEKDEVEVEVEGKEKNHQPPPLPTRFKDPALAKIQLERGFSDTNLSKWLAIAKGDAAFLAETIAAWDAECDSHPEFAHRPAVARFNQYLTKRLRTRDSPPKKAGFLSFGVPDV